MSLTNSNQFGYQSPFGWINDGSMNNSVETILQTVTKGVTLVPVSNSSSIPNYTQGTLWNQSYTGSTGGAGFLEFGNTYVSLQSTGGTGLANNIPVYNDQGILSTVSSSTSANINQPVSIYSIISKFR